MSAVTGLRITYEMMDVETRATALQNDALLAGRQQEAARTQHLLEAESELRARLARQEATSSKQAATISEQAATLVQQTSSPSNMTLQTSVMLLAIGVCCAKVAACRPCNCPCLHLS